MKTLTTLFAAEKNKKTGAKPVWILKCPFATGTVYLSDYAFTVAGWNGGITTLPWIKNWAAIDENIGSGMSSAQISDWSLDLLVDQNAALNIHDILWSGANNIETTDCTLYLWFVGLNAVTTPPQAMSTWNMIDWDSVDELVESVRLVSLGVRLDKYVGTKITRALYPLADPDDIGKSTNIIIGSPNKVPCHAVEAGWLGSIASNDLFENGIQRGINSTQTTIEISDVSWLPAIPFTAKCHEEQMRVTGLNTATRVMTVTRGYNSTKAVVHGKGSALYEVRNRYVYMAADHPVKTIRNVYVDGTRINSGVTTYTGRAGNAHADFPDKAVVLFSDMQLGMDVNSDAERIEQAAGNLVQSVFVLTGAVDFYYARATTVAEAYAFAYTVLLGSMTHYFNGNIGNWGCQIYIGTSGGGADQLLYSAGGGGVTTYKSAFTFSKGGDVILKYRPSGVLTGSNAHTVLNGGSCQITQKIIARNNLSGNSAANYVIGALVTVDADGAFDSDASITGILNLLLTSPVHVLKWLYYRYANWPIANWNNTGNEIIPISAVHKINDWVNAPSSVTTASVSLSANKLYLLAIFNSRLPAPSTKPTVSGAGRTWTEVATITDSSTARRTTLFRSLSGSAGSGALTISFGGVTQNNCAYSLDEISGIDTSGSNGAGAISQIKTGAGGTNTGLSIPLVEFALPYNACYGCVRPSDGGTVVSGSGFTTLIASSTMGVEISAYERTAVDWTWNSVSPLAVGIAIELKIDPTLLPLYIRNNYSFTGVINDYPKLRDISSKLAWQCRSYFRITHQAELIWRETSKASVKTIANAAIRMTPDLRTTLKKSRGPLTDVINKLTVFYNRDWTKSGSDAYQSSTPEATNPASIARYGEKEKPELFYFDYVTNSVQALEAASFYLHDLKDRPKIFTGDLFLDQVELEFADWVLLDDEDSVVELRKVNMAPGSGRDMRNDIIQIMAREYASFFGLTVEAGVEISITIADNYGLDVACGCEITLTMQDNYALVVESGVEISLPGYLTGFGSDFGSNFGN